MSRGPDAATLVERALRASAERAGCPVTVLSADWRRWASATFAGARHFLTLTAPASPRLDAWIAALPEVELRLRGHLVADLAVQRVAREGTVNGVNILLEILTVEEP